MSPTSFPVIGKAMKSQACEDATLTPDSTEEVQSSHLDEAQSDADSLGEGDRAYMEPKERYCAISKSSDLGIAAASHVPVTKLDACDSEALVTDDARAVHETSSLQRMKQRLPALLVTFAIEMVVGFVISNFTDTFKRYPLLISFQPVISAISGNFGLQASSTNIRALAVGLLSTKRGDMLSAIGREVRTGAFAGVAMASVAGATAFFWYSPLASGDGHTWAGAWAFAASIWVGLFISIMSAALTGSAAPLLSKRCGMDPTATAGPLETAFQDVVGGTALLALSACILAAFGDYAGECPGGSLSSCIDLCQGMGGFNVTADRWSCVHSCVAMVDEGLC